MSAPFPIEYFEDVILPERFGWTWPQIDAMPLWRKQRLIQMLSLEAEYG